MANFKAIHLNTDKKSKNQSCHSYMASSERCTWAGFCLKITLFFPELVNPLQGLTRYSLYNFFFLIGGGRWQSQLGSLVCLWVVWELADGGAKCTGTIAVSIHKDTKTWERVWWPGVWLTRPSPDACMTLDSQIPCLSLSFLMWEKTD